MFPLKGVPQKYAWGKLGSSSYVGKVLNLQGESVEESSPYAEIWYGDHPSGPSRVVLEDGSEQDLSVFLSDNPELLGPDREQWGGNSMPFLFKVGWKSFILMFQILSINKALSLQAHPDKELASQLHRQFPDQYRDPNHKPEVAIALTPMRALCGFRPLIEIAQNLRDVLKLI